MQMTSHAAAAPLELMRAMPKREAPVTVSFEGSRGIMRLLMRVTSAAFLSAFAALWVLPGSIWAPEQMLIKIGVSLLFVGIGATLWLAARAGETPMVRFDPIRREVSILRPGPSGHTVAVMHRAYETFSMAQIDNGQISLWDQNKVLVFQFPVSDRVARQALRRQFQSILMVS